MWIIFETGWCKNYPHTARLVGVFKKQPDAQEYFSFLKNTRSSCSHELRKISKSNYPIFFIYTELNGHNYVTQEKLAKLLWFLKKVEDDAHIYCRYTIICEDYRGFEQNAHRNPVPSGMGLGEQSNLENILAVGESPSFKEGVLQTGDEKYHSPRIDRIDNEYMVEDVIMSGLYSKYYMSKAGYYSCANFECGKHYFGSLSENGYQPPPGWKIVPFMDSYVTVCSKKCSETFFSFMKPLLMKT